MDFNLRDATDSPFAIGAAGGLVYVLRFMPGAGWGERLVNLVSGTLCAGFVGPAVGEWLHLTSEGMRGGLAFLVGLLGVSLLAAALEWLRSGALGEILAGWLRRG